MAYVPEFKYDVFISYEREANKAGWVTRLRTQIEEQLGDLGRPKPVVWMDDELDYGDAWPAKVEDAVDNSAVLLAVITPGYLQSNECMERELRRFVRSKPNAPVVQAIKTALGPGQRVPIPGSNFVEFFKDGVSISKRSGTFESRARKVGASVCAHLRVMRNSRTKVYVTWISPGRRDFEERRDELAEEFNARGYDVQPVQVPAEPIAEDLATREAVEKSSAFVYLYPGAADQNAYEAGQFRLSSNRPSVICAEEKELIPASLSTELPIRFNHPDWKGTAVNRVKALLSEQADA